MRKNKRPAWTEWCYLAAIGMLFACGGPSSPGPSLLATSTPTPMVGEVVTSPTPSGGGTPTISPGTEIPLLTPTMSTRSSGAPEMGKLQFRANGEDFIRRGFTSSDGWELRFTHVYVTLDKLTAYQADPPYDPHRGGPVQATKQVSLERPYTVDLAAGDEDAEPILVAEVPAPPGRYNALSWSMVRAIEGPASGAVILMEGTARKGERNITFRIALDRETSHTCGDYVGEQRKGLLEAGGTAEVEATFHFDHLFGDGSMPADDEINTQALGFDVLAALASDGVLDVNTATLRERLAPEDFAKIERLHLAHVGEGHCTGEGHGS